MTAGQATPAFAEMKPLLRKPKTRGAAEFHLRHPENLLLVRGTEEGGVLICATADNLTPQQREAFVRYLGVEGFVAGDAEPPDRFHERLFNGEGQPVRWIVDPSWPEVDPAYALHIRRLCWYAAGTVMVWCTLLAVLVCC